MVPIRNRNGCRLHLSVRWVNPFWTAKSARLTVGAFRTSNVAKYSGIYLIEDRASDRSSSAKPFLKLLEWCHGIQFECRQAADGDELLEHVKEWARKEEWDLSILYFWGHGSPNALWVGNDQVLLKQISAKINGAWEESALVHFGACSTLRVTDDDFLHESGVAAVSGYREDVDWIETLAFEMLYMSRLQSVASRMEEQSENIYLTPEIMRNVWKELEEGPLKALVSHLHFDMRIASNRG